MLERAETPSKASLRLTIEQFFSAFVRIITVRTVGRLARSNGYGSAVRGSPNSLPQKRRPEKTKVLFSGGRFLVQTQNAQTPKKEAVEKQAED